MKKIVEGEVWKDIPGYEGRYQASTAGRIRSIDRAVTQMSRHGSTFTRQLKGKILRPGEFCKSGHVSVVLGHGANGSPVHQLVMLTFVGPAEPGMEVLHGNGNPKDNRLANLRYGTRTENILDVFHQGGVWRKISAQQALEVKRRLKKGEVCTHIARRMSIGVSSVYAIKSGRTFSWLNEC